MMPGDPSTRGAEDVDGEGVRGVERACGEVVREGGGKARPDGWVGGMMCYGGGGVFRRGCWGGGR